MTDALAPNSIVAHRYEIREALAERPAYLEYRAFDLDIEVDISVWWIRRELFPGAAADRLVEAARRVRDVRHANLRRLIDAGREGDGVYITAQLVSSERVVPRVRPGAVLDDADLLHFATSVVDGLAAAHSNGFVHGRLVPDDIDHVARLIKLSGAGLYAGADLDVARTLWEPYSYFLAPEVRTGEPASVRSDVYSAARIIAHIAGGVDALAAERPELIDVFEQAWAEDATARTGSVEELLDRVQSILVDGRVPTNERAAAVPPEHLEADDGMPELPEEFSRPPTLDVPLEDMPPDMRVAGAADRMATVPGRPAARRTNTPAPAARGKGPIDFSSLQLTDVDDDMPRDRVTTRPIRKLAPSFDNEQETVLDGGFVSGAPPPPGPTGALADDDDEMGDDDLDAPTLQNAEPAPKKRPLAFQSMKPQDDSSPKATPPVPAIDRPELKPRLRAISSSMDEVPSQLGNYAPPRPKGGSGSPRRLAVLAGLLLGAVLLGFVVVLLLVRLWGAGGDDEDVSEASGANDPESSVDAAAAAPAPRPIVSPTARKADAGVRKPRCPDDMVMVTSAAEPYCIDQYESPGRGRFPASGMTLASAQRSCKKRGARLCTPAEWTRACRGRNRASYPYGSTPMAKVCNVRGAIRAAGSYGGCRSASGAYDMAGNVAEWVQGGIVKGGSARDRSMGRCSAVQKPPGRGNQGFGDVGFRCCAAPRRL